MGQYFFKMSQAEKNSILDKHKTIYDGYVTEYGKQSNEQPLYVQDYANDKLGITVSNKGVVKPYTNIGINESHSGLDMIGDDSEHLINGTVDLGDYGFNSDNEEYPSPNEDEIEYVSLGKQKDNGECDDSDEYFNFDYEEELEEGFDDFNIMDLRGGVDYSEKEFPKSNKYKVSHINLGDTIDNINDPNSNEFDFEEVDEEILPEFMEKLHESIDMFGRFKKYN